MPKQFEYMRATIDNADETSGTGIAQINAFGGQGWQVVNIQYRERAAYVLLMREIEPRG